MSQKLTISHNKNCHLIYDLNFLKQPKAGLLSGEIFNQANSYKKVSTGGRGQAWFIEMPEFSAVLRTYLRGGLVAKINKQAYLGLSRENSRSFKEWRLLKWMFDQGLPVPKPIAASFCRWPISLSPFYRAHILVERIPGVQTLDQLLCRAIVDNSSWNSVGKCVRRFHNESIYHADLNANNILLDEKQTVYLIDFDKGELRLNQQENAQWKQANLDRLKRSFLKQQALHKQYHFSEQCWNELMLGYNS